MLTFSLVFISFSLFLFVVWVICQGQDLKVRKKNYVIITQRKDHTILEISIQDLQNQYIKCSLQCDIPLPYKIHTPVICSLIVFYFS